MTGCEFLKFYLWMVAFLGIVEIIYPYIDKFISAIINLFSKKKKQA